MDNSSSTWACRPKVITLITSWQAASWWSHYRSSSLPSSSYISESYIGRLKSYTYMYTRESTDAVSSSRLYPSSLSYCCSSSSPAYYLIIHDTQPTTTAKLPRIYKKTCTTRVLVDQHYIAGSHLLPEIVFFNSYPRKKITINHRFSIEMLQCGKMNSEWTFQRK